MFLSSRYPMPAARGGEEVCSERSPAGEGRNCEACRRISAALLLREGRPAAWLVLLVAACAYVVVQALSMG